MTEYNLTKKEFFVFQGPKMLYKYTPFCISVTSRRCDSLLLAKICFISAVGIRSNAVTGEYRRICTFSVGIAKKPLVKSVLIEENAL